MYQISPLNRTYRRWLRNNLWPWKTPLLQPLHPPIVSCREANGNHITPYEKLKSWKVHDWLTTKTSLKNLKKEKKLKFKTFPHALKTYYLCFRGTLIHLFSSCKEERWNLRNFLWWVAIKDIRCTKNFLVVLNMVGGQSLLNNNWQNKRKWL